MRSHDPIRVIFSPLGHLSPYCHRCLLQLARQSTSFHSLKCAEKYHVSTSAMNLLPEYQMFLLRCSGSTKKRSRGGSIHRF